MTQPEAYLRIADVSKVYATRGGPVRAVDNVSLTAHRGEFVSVVGPSGCGKSTMLMMAAGLLPVSSGVISVAGEPVTRPRTDLGIVFQSPVLLEWRTALGNVLLQARAAGEIGTLADLRTVVRESSELKTFEPRNVAQWDEAYSRFEKL